MAQRNVSADGSELKRKAVELLAHRKELPIWSARKKFNSVVAENDTTILISETGSGKTTQAPQFVHYGRVAGEGCIACTQPRRVAAITVAQRVADEAGVELGKEVGYSIRFDDRTSPSTRIKYMTDGMLIREALLDSALLKYSVIFIDEAHERTVNTDVLMGLLKGAQQQRRGTERPLKLVVMSATLDQAGFAKYFDGAQAAYVEGRQFPVQIMYTAEPQDSYVQAAINTVLQVHTDEEAGAVLVFLTGQEEIEAVQRVLQEQADALHATDPSRPKLHVVAIYAAMPPEQQLLAFQPAPDGSRKVILSTNIAETSVTLPGVRFVVDTGMVKARAYSAAKGMESLQVVPVSKAQARQRSGRAGREGPGKCFRLYTEAAFRALADATVPEIQRSNLATVVLQLKVIGVHDILRFDFMDPPPRSALLKALELLYALKAMDGNGELTQRGQQMARLPVDPAYAAVLIAAADTGCLRECIAIVSMVSSDRITYSPKGKEAEAAQAHKRHQSVHGDHLTLLNIFQAYNSVSVKKRSAWCSQNFINSRSMRHAASVHDQLQGHVEAMGFKVKSCGDDYAVVRQALVTGLFLNAALRQPDNSYKVVASGQRAAIHPSSCLLGRRPECIVFNELILTGKAYAQCVTSIEPGWLTELVPRFFSAPSNSPS